jgi:DNA invertase Pin-like site-specific DNA recombinase
MIAAMASWPSLDCLPNEQGDGDRPAGAGFRSLTENIDTTVPAGRMLMQMLGAFAEFERAMIRERTRSGLAAARAKGRAWGRRREAHP